MMSKRSVAIANTKMRCRLSRARCTSQTSISRPHRRSINEGRDDPVPRLVRRRPALAAKRRLPALTRSGLAHLYFVSIHPFEDGNGRIGRAISEKALSQAIGQPSLIALSQTIQHKRSAYYDALEAANKSNEVTDWLVYFAETVLDAQSHSLTTH
jgi:Fic family protein